MKINEKLTKDIDDKIDSKFDELETKTSITKLWENANPDSSFSAQTITLESDDYDYLIWFLKNLSSDSQNRQLSIMSLKGAGVYITIGSDYAPSSTYYVATFVREINNTDNLNFSISDCYVRHSNSTTRVSITDRLIPVAVYGGKF